MNRYASWLLFFLAMTVLCGCGQKQRQKNIPADSFFLSVEDQPGPSVVPIEPGQSEVKKTVTLERPPTTNGEVVKPLQLQVGIGEQFNNMTGIQVAIDPTRKTFITISVATVQKVGTEDRFVRFGAEIRNESKQDAGLPKLKDVSMFGYNPNAPLLKDQKLADVLAINVQPTLYKVGSSVGLGSVWLDSKQQPLTLYVRWADDPKE